MEIELITPEQLSTVAGSIRKISEDIKTSIVEIKAKFPIAFGGTADRALVQTKALSEINLRHIQYAQRLMKQLDQIDHYDEKAVAAKILAQLNMNQIELDNLEIVLLHLAD